MKKRVFDWKENGRFFKLENRENEAGCFLLCSITDGDGKKHRIFFPEGKGLIKGWALLVEKFRELGVKGKLEERGKVEERGKKREEIGQRVFAHNDLSFVEVTRSKTVANTVWVDVGDCVSKETPGVLKHCLVGRWKDLPVSLPSASNVEAWARTVWRLKSNHMVYQLSKDLL